MWIIIIEEVVIRCVYVIVITLTTIIIKHLRPSAYALHHVAPLKVHW